MRHEFDVAISFAGPERDYARAIASIAQANGVKVFLDEFYESHIWGKNLVEFLSDIYEKKARYCLIIISKEYCQRIYTNVERRAALDRAITNKSEYILPIVTDNSWIDGLPKATAYLDLRRKSIIKICEALVKKILGDKSPQQLELPKDIHITRLPICSLNADELQQYLLEICEQSQHLGVVAFGCIVYDESTVELRKLLQDQDYWDALDASSGTSFEVFAVKDEEKYGYDKSHTFELMTGATLSRPRSKGYFFSKLLNEYFGEEKTTLAYPSFVLFLVENLKVTHCRRIPLSRDTMHNIFIRLQSMFTTISNSINEWRLSGAESASTLWEIMKKKLLDEDYTIYIHNAPKTASEAISSLAPFFE